MSSISRTIGATAIWLSLMSSPTASNKPQIPETNNAFQIPQWSGTIVASYKGKTDKQVLYILDHHATWNWYDVAIDWLDPAGMATQRSIFNILDDSIKRQWSITLLQEAWSFKKGESQSDFVKRNLAGFGLKPWLPIEKAHSLDGGYSTAIKLVGNSLHQATNLIAAVYGQKVINIAPMDTQQELDVIRKDVTVGVVRNLVSSREITCGDIGSKPKNLSLAQATTWLSDSTKSNPCGCGVMTTYSDTFRVWSTSRYKIAAIREIDKITASNMGNLVVVAWGGHAYHAMQRMEEKWISYHVVIPTGADKSRIDIKRDPVVTESQRLENALACLSNHKKPIPGFQRLVSENVNWGMSDARIMLQQLEGKK